MRRAEIGRVKGREINRENPGCCGSLGWSIVPLSHTQGINSLAGHMPRLPSQGACRQATN